jgi:hypothetical protein
MAKLVYGDFIEFDATTQGEGFGPNKDSISVVNTGKLYVRRFKVDTGDGGDVLVRSRLNAGAADHARFDVLKADSTPANDTLDWPYHGYVDGLYVVTLPTNAKIIVLLGEE